MKLFLFIIISAFSRKDTTIKVKPDSVMVYPDTLILKIPQDKIPQFFSAFSMNDDISKNAFVEMVGIITRQTQKQLIKKPKK